MMKGETVSTWSPNSHTNQKSFSILLIFLMLTSIFTGSVLLTLEKNHFNLMSGNDSKTFPETKDEEDKGFDKPLRQTRAGGEEDIILNEIMLLPKEGGPWIEIFNSGSESVSVDNWLISDEDGLTYELGNLPDMPPGSYIVIHFDHGENDSFFGQSQVNALHVYTGWKNVRWTRYVVDSDQLAARAALGYDIIPGGKPEILVNKFNNGRFFYEPKADMTAEWDITQIIEQNLGNLHRIKPIDIDDDGLTDIVSIYCFTPGTKRVHWIKQPPIITDKWDGAYQIDDMEGLKGIDAGNISGDNLMDVVVSQSDDPNYNIFWYESPNPPTIANWNRYTIDNTLIQPGGLSLVDLDNDTDLDIVAVGSWGEEVVWYEHPLNPTNPWTKHIIATPTEPPGPDSDPQHNAVGELIVGDIDDDQNLEVIVSESKQNRIVWYNYTTDPKGPWTQHIIDDDILGPSGLDLGDLDGDGDLDVMLAATSGIIAWYPKPTPGKLYSPNWPRYHADSSLHLPFYVSAADFDGDGDLDITSSDQSEGKVYWYENDFFNFTIQDQCALYNSSIRTSENIIDFVAWGGPALAEDTLAVDAGIWQDEAYIDIAGSGLNKTLARDRNSTDTDVPEDWDVECGIHSDIPTPGTVNDPNPVNLEFKIEYNPIVFMGGLDPPSSMPSGLCLANYSSYTFKINVSNPFGWSDLEWVELILDPDGEGISLVWTQEENNFSLNNAYNYISFVSEACSTSTDNIYTWQLNFTVIFNWTYPSESLQDAKVICHNNLGYEDIDIYNDFYQVVKSLDFKGDIIVMGLETGEILDLNEWVTPGTELIVTGPKIVYNIQNNDYYPADSQFNAILQDNLGNSWIDYTSAGFPVNFSISVPNKALTGQYNLTLILTDLPQGVIAQDGPSHQLFIDAGILDFESLSPQGTVWQTDSNIECIVRITDIPDESGVCGNTIEYRVANGSVDRFGDWIPAPQQDDNDTIESKITYDFPEGPNNWIQWRAEDVAGNGPNSSTPYRVAVDTLDVTFHDFYPPPTIIHESNEVIIYVTLADFGGSGVDISTFQAAIKTEGENDYGGWFYPDFVIENQTDPISEEVLSGPETVQVSATILGFLNGENYIKFRARDIAGNSPAISPSYRILVDTKEVTYHDFYPSPLHINNATTITINITVVDFGGSGINVSSLEVAIKAADEDTFGDWYYPGFIVINATSPATGSVPSGPETVRVSTAIRFRNGTDNYIKFRACDMIGNGPTASPSYRIPIDTKEVTYHDFYPSTFHIYNNTNVTVNITVADLGGSGVNISSLEVSVKPMGEVVFGDWFNPDFIIINQSSPSEFIPSGPETVRVSIKIAGFQNGMKNYIRFRAYDMVGNGPAISQSYLIPVDTKEVTYHDFYPSPLHVFNDQNVTVYLTIADFAGSGVNISSLEAAFMPSGESAFGDWFDIGFIIINESSPASELVPTGPEKVRISTNITNLQNGTNYVKFRALDMVGNGFSESEEFSIQIDLYPNASDGILPDGSGPDGSGSDDTVPEDADEGPKIDDYWLWLWYLMVILVILTMITLWNYHRLQSKSETDYKEENESSEDKIEEESEEKDDKEEKGDGETVE